MAESLDLLFVVGNMDAETFVLQETILLELLHDAFDNGLAQPSGIYGCLLGDPATAMGVYAPARASASEALGVAEKANRLLYGAALQRSVSDLRSVLALVPVREHNARNFHQLLHGR